MSLIHPVTVNEPRESTGSEDRTKTGSEDSTTTGSEGKTTTGSESRTTTGFEDKINPSPSQTYVKGYAIRYTLLKKLIGATEITDRRIGDFEYEMMKHVDRDVQKLVVAQRIDGEVKSCFSVIALDHEESFGEDLDALRRKKITVPKYLRDWAEAEALEAGPDVYKLYAGR